MACPLRDNISLSLVTSYWLAETVSFPMVRRPHLRLAFCAWVAVASRPIGRLQRSRDRRAGTHAGRNLEVILNFVESATEQTEAGTKLVINHLRHLPWKASGNPIHSGGASQPSIHHLPILVAWIAPHPTRRQQAQLAAEARKPADVVVVWTRLWRSQARPCQHQPKAAQSQAQAHRQRLLDWRITDAQGTLAVERGVMHPGTCTSPQKKGRTRRDTRRRRCNRAGTHTPLEQSTHTRQGPGFALQVSSVSGEHTLARRDPEP